MLQRIKISGHSLSPDFEEGDFVITIKIPLFFRFIKSGDIVVLELSPYGKIIKRVERVDLNKKQMFVTGNHPFSVDSRDFGPVPFKNLIGKVIWHIPRPRKYEA